MKQLTNIAPMAARSTNGVSDEIDAGPNAAGFGAFVVNVTASPEPNDVPSPSDPALTIIIESSPTSGSGYSERLRCNPIKGVRNAALTYTSTVGTGAGADRADSRADSVSLDRYSRVRWEMSGNAPQFTFSVDAAVG